MANQNLSQFGEKLFVADADHTFIWDTAASISKRVSRNSWLSGTTADFHLGLADAASPVAQTISVQSVVAGTSNTAGANFSINGSQGTGTGAGGALLLRTAPAGSSGTAQNALVTAVAITSAGNVGIGTTAPGAKLQVNTNTNGVNFATVFYNENGTQGGNAVGCAFINETGNASHYKAAIVHERTDTWARGKLHFLNSSNTAGVVALADARMTIEMGGNVGIGTTSPTSKLHVAGSSSPSITVDNTIATGASQLLFKNTVVTGDTDGIFLNGSAQSGFGGNGSLNIKATTGPLAFHTASVTNALSIAQNGAITCIQSITSQSSISANTNAYIMWGGGTSSRMLAPSDGIIQFTDAATTGFNRLQFGGTTNLFPAIKRSAVRIQAVLANDTGFTNIQGKLTTDTDYTATVVTPTGFLTLYDAQGTAYRVPCVAA